MSNTALTTLIISEIERDGPMRFDRFMEISLYDPDAGYFTSGRVRSEREGDFLTSPEVSPLFGETLGRFVAAEWERVGEPFTLIEAGAGTGTLLRPLLDAIGTAPTVYAVEVSASARERLSATVPEATVVASMEAVPGAIDGVIVVNEMLDNLPASVAVRRGEAWVERAVVAEGDRLAMTEVDARPDVVEWAEAHGGRVPDGGFVEVQLAATEWVADAAGRLRRGSLVIFDYGDIADALEHRRVDGTVRTYRRHHLGPDPILEPGHTDITMDVNFTAVVAAAEGVGCTVSIHRQVDFLTEWRLPDTIVGLRERELAAARDGGTMQRLALRSAITDAEALLHPRGLGDFRVVVARR